MWLPARRWLRIHFHQPTTQLGPQLFQVQPPPQLASPPRWGPRLPPPRRLPSWTPPPCGPTGRQGWPWRRSPAAPSAQAPVPAHVLPRNPLRWRPAPGASWRGTPPAGHAPRIRVAKPSWRRPSRPAAPAVGPPPRGGWAPRAPPQLPPQLVARARARWAQSCFPPLSQLDPPELAALGAPQPPSWLLQLELAPTARGACGGLVLGAARASARGALPVPCRP